MIHTFPEDPRRLRSYQAGTADSWVTFVFGVSVRAGSASFTWEDADGAPIAFQLEGTQWGNTWPRLMRLMPEVDLAPGGFFEVTLQPGFARIDDPERGAGDGHTHTFQSSCLEGMLDVCPALGPIPGPSLDGPMSEPVDDAGGDASARPDAGDPGDASAGAPDTTPTDDASPSDDAGDASPGGGGCAMAAPGRATAASALLALLWWRRRREGDR